MQLVSMRKLLENGVHFGHQTRRWDPKCKPFIYTAKNSIYIIDLNKTQEALQVAYDKMKSIAEEGGKVLFVGTKKQAQQIILDEATRSGSFYINQRWLGGTLTNFRTIQKRIKRLIEIEQMEADGTISVYPKKEQVLIHKEAVRLENFLGGIKEMKKLPDAIVVVDPKEDHNAVSEAKKLGWLMLSSNPRAVSSRMLTRKAISKMISRWKMSSSTLKNTLKNRKREEEPETKKETTVSITEVREDITPKRDISTRRMKTLQLKLRLPK